MERVTYASKRRRRSTTLSRRLAIRNPFPIDWLVSHPGNATRLIAIVWHEASSRKSRLAIENLANPLFRVFDGGICPVISGLVTNLLQFRSCEVPIERLDNIFTALLFLLLGTGCSRVEVEDDVMYDETVTVSGLKQAKSQTISASNAFVTGLPKSTRRRSKLGQSSPKVLILGLSL